MAGLASSYDKAGRNGEAFKLNQQVLEMRKNKLGPDHPSTLTSMSNLASSYAKAGKKSEALRLFQQVLELRKTKLGPNHPRTLHSMANLAATYKNSGRVEDAILMFEKAFERSKNKGSLRQFVPHLRDAYIKGKRVEKLKELLQTSISKTRATSDQIALRRELGQSGYALLQVEAYVEAEKLLLENHELFSEEEAGSWQKFNAQSLLGAALLKQEKHEEAAPLLTKGFAGLNDNAEQIPKTVRFKYLSRSAQWLIELAEATENEEDVEKWTAEKERIKNEHGQDPKTDSD